MDSLRDLTLTCISQTIAFTRLLQYWILLPFTPVLEFFVKKICLDCGVEINGKRPCDIVVKDRRSYARLITYGPLAIGESYLEGWWEFHDMNEFFIKLVNRGWTLVWYKLPWNRLNNYLQFECLNTQSRQRAAYSCDPQYNLGMDFFKHFLDESMTYSVGYWKKGAKNLEEAQLHKMEVVAQKLKLKPGMRVLDLGCGFGGLSKYLATNYKVNVVGITNSSVMGKEAAKRCEGLPVQIKITDWRDFVGTFDRVVSIEMVFHVGKHNLDGFFKQVGKWLKDKDGIFVMQDLSVGNGIFCSDEFVSKYLFPFVYFARADEIIKRAAPYLALEHYEDMTEDWPPTGKAFFQAIDKVHPLFVQEFGIKIYKLMRFLFFTGEALSKTKLFIPYQMTFTKIPEMF